MKFQFWIFVCLFIIALPRPEALLIPTEAVALQDMCNSFASSQNANWTCQESALACENRWLGITCSGGLDHILTVDLFNVTLSGTLSPSIGAFHELLTLRISMAQLSGTLPNSLGQLTNLTVIDLSFNALDGPLPTGFFQLRSLQLLSLSGNRITGAIDALSSMTTLGYLDLSGNPLDTTLPQNVGVLTKLTTILLSGSHLVGTIPQTLGSLVSLGQLDLSDNLLAGSIPSSLFTQMPSLILLSLSKNRLLGGLSGALFPPSLQALILANNLFTGTLPTDITLLSRLSVLSLHGNHLSGTIPPEIASMPDLASLTLSNNELFGTIPAVLGTMPKLKAISIGGNTLCGCWPFNEASLDFCSASGLVLCCGSSPSPFCNNNNTLPCQNCSSCSSSCPGSPPPPVTLPRVLDHADARALTDLCLIWGLQRPPSWDCDTALFSGCQWSGVVCSPDGQRVLRISITRSSRYRGPLPALAPSMSSMSTLTILEITHGAFSGTIPDWIGSLSGLGVLDLSSNQLGGTLPNSLGALTSLTYLNLRQNRLSGTLPSTLGALTEMRVFDVSHNSLSGAVPAALSSHQQLFSLFLRNNAFFGPLPAEFSTLASVRALDLQGNFFCGCWPFAQDQELFYCRPGAQAYCCMSTPNSTTCPQPNTTCTPCSCNTFDAQCLFPQLNITVPVIINTPAQIAIQGNFTTSGTLTLALAAARPLNVSGCASFGGNLVVDVTGVSGGNRTLASYSCFSGAFKNVTVSSKDPCDAVSFDALSQIVYSATSVSIAFSVKNVCSTPLPGFIPGLDFVQSVSVVVALPVLVGLSVFLIVALAVPRCRKRVFPFRDRTRYQGSMKLELRPAPSRNYGSSSPPHSAPPSSGRTRGDAF